MHPGMYALTLFLDKPLKVKLGKVAMEFPEGFYLYVEGHTDAHGRIDAHLTRRKGADRIDLFLQKAHVLDTKVSRVRYASGKAMLRDVLKVRAMLTGKLKAQVTPIFGLYHVSGPVIVSPKFSRMFA